MGMHLVRDMFVLGLPVAEKIIRPVLVYVFLIVAFRLAGKRELAQLNPFDLVVLLTISNTVQNAIIGEDNSVTGGLIGAATLLIVNHVVVRYLYSHESLERLVEGDEDVLIEDGEIHTERMRRELITEGELLSAARKQGFSRLTDVDRATIEPGGTIVFLGRKQPVEPSRDDELLKKLDEVRAELASLRGAPRTEP